MLHGTSTARSWRARKRGEQPTVAADRVVQAQRPERDEEARVRVGNPQLSRLLFKRLQDLRRLPLRARHVERLAILGGGKHAAGKFPDVGRRKVLHLLERKVQPLGADDVEAVYAQVRGQRIVVALGIGRRNYDATC